MMTSVHGKTALITGAGSGINLCFARLLIEKGCNVAIVDIKLRAEAQELVDRYYASRPGVIFIKTDVAHWDQLQHAMDVCEATFGEIDIVCPGAGIFEPPQSAFWYPPGSLQSSDSVMESRYRIVDVNFVHPIRMTQLAISHFLKSAARVEQKKKKHILLVTSIAGHMPVFVAPLYSSTKHGVSALVQSLAPLDDGSNIRVVGVAPGITATPIWFESEDDKKALVNETVDEWVSPEDVAIVMLALVERDFIAKNLEDIDQDGGTIRIQGGTILEVSKSVRSISIFNDPGPVGRPGNTLGNMAQAEENILQMLSHSVTEN